MKPVLRSFNLLILSAYLISMESKCVCAVRNLATHPQLSRLNILVSAVSPGTIRALVAFQAFPRSLLRAKFLRAFLVSYLSSRITFQCVPPFYCALLFVAHFFGTMPSNGALAFVSDDTPLHSSFCRAPILVPSCTYLTIVASNRLSSLSRVSR